MLKIRLVVLALVALLLPAVTHAAKTSDFVIIVNSANPTEDLSRQEVARMFLKQRARWDHGERVRPVDLSGSWKVRDDFSLAVFRRTTRDIEEHWKRMVFSGRDVPPPEKGSEQEILDYVELNPGAIGYLSRGTPLSRRVKVIEIVD